MRRLTPESLKINRKVILATLLQIAIFNRFQPETAIWIAVLAVLVFISALMSASDAAFFSLSRTDLDKIKKSSSAADGTILRLLAMPEYLLSTVLTAGVFVNILAVLLAGLIIDQLVQFTGDAWEYVIKTVVIAFVLLLFAVVIPRMYGAYNPLGVARAMSRPVMGMKHFLKPLLWLFVRLSGTASKRSAHKKGNLSIDELSKAIEITGDQSEEEKQMLSGIVGFVNTEVNSIMKPRMDIVALDMASDFAQVKRVIIESGFSRIPVWEENIDGIKGILYVKDMLPFISRGDDFYWQAYLRQPYFVPEHKKINDLMEEFQSEKVHMAIVVDEYGSTLGLVSLEDILEEIVGEITDESDVQTPECYQKIDENNYIFEGKTPLADVEEILGFDEGYFGELEHDAETLAGLMLEIKCDFLKKGESVMARGIKFTVEALDGRRIDKALVDIRDAEPGKEPQGER